MNYKVCRMTYTGDYNIRLNIIIDLTSNILYLKFQVYNKMYNYIVQNFQPLFCGFTSGVVFCLFMTHLNHPRPFVICNILREPIDKDYTHDCIYAH